MFLRGSVTKSPWWKRPGRLATTTGQITRCILKTLTTCRFEKVPGLFFTWPRHRPASLPAAHSSYFENFSARRKKRERERVPHFLPNAAKPLPILVKSRRSRNSPERRKRGLFVRAFISDSFDARQDVLFHFRNYRSPR